MMSDILFRDEIGRLALRTAASRAFGLAAGFIAVDDLAGVRPVPKGAHVVLLREPEDMAGDFPVWYGLAVDETLVDRVIPAIDVITRELGTVALTEGRDEDEMTLHLPDGTHRIVPLTQDDAAAFRITPEMRTLIERATSRFAVAGTGT